MARLIDVLDRLRAAAALWYRDKDTMHDLSHIDRVTRAALSFTTDSVADRATLEAAALFHGVVYSQEADIRSLLEAEGIEAPDVERVIAVSWESQKEAAPQTPEGRILHDAHLLEGDENFLVTKALVTGSVRGQSLSATIDYMESQLGAHRCALPENQKEYERRELVVRNYIAKLRPFL